MSTRSTPRMTRDKKRIQAAPGIPARTDNLKLLGPLETRVATLEAAVSQAATLKIVSLRG